MKVVQPLYPCHDIVYGLNNIAKKIENKELGEVIALTLVLENNDETQSYSFGPSCNLEKTVYLLMKSAKYLLGN